MGSPARGPVLLRDPHWGSKRSPKVGKKGAKARKKSDPYHSVSNEDREVYHNDSDCWEGKKIKKKNLKPGKAGRDLCEICAAN
jgi:hypothetical protein